MDQLKLSRETGNGWYFTLPGVGIIVEIINEAIQKAGANPNDVVLKFTHGNNGNFIDIMYPTPHTYLLSSFRLEGELIKFSVGQDRWSKFDRREFPVADPNIAASIANSIKDRAKSHKATRQALNSA